ncbi:T9SS-dependent choice-of-anchor J family protein [Flavobacterium wongokense]|uniref:T9SS-dependent choice-of-anchor J family protein n=1 Tax=Flavobacterium wongokense TaxID=2910674 RepID=UPI001F3C2C34|nr:T9SS type A sorting domain-containing protein [Flavobacterium sp. WG47]MCF6130954.1 T9SS type A sorting domain-containing protein [Flavobacterium sp. WG47]
MKKITLILLFFLSVFELSAQVDHYAVVEGIATSQLGRNPQGARNVTRSVWLVTTAEMTAGGFVAGDVIAGLGFSYQVAQATATTGTCVIYLQNTTDTANTKSTTWATAIGGMTTVSNGAYTIPAAAGEINYDFSGGSPFTYTGGAVYVAIDYQSPTVSATPNTAYCNNALTGGVKSAMSAAASTTPPTTVAASNFRPVTRLGKSVTCSRPYNLYSDVTVNTTTSASLTFNPLGGTDFEIEYGAYGFTPGSGTTLTGITGSPYTIPGLSASTVYDVYIRKNCGSSFSGWNGPYSLNTVFTPASSPYNTSFEQETLPFSGWATPNAIPLAGDWATGIFGPGALVQDGSVSALSITPTTGANNWMFSRGVNLTAGSNVTITYYVSNFQSASTTTGSLDFTVGDAQTSAAQSTILLSETGLNLAAFVQKTVNFTPTTTGVHYFGFRNFTPAATGTHAIIVDNFTVTEVLGMSQNELDSHFSVFPNPTKNIINISNSMDASIQTVELSDLNGRSIKNVKVADLNETQLNISDISQGVYMLRIATDKGTLIKKVVKE